MTVQDSIAKSAAAQTTKPPRWARMLLGGVMALAGLAVLADVAFASLISSAFLGTIAIAVGAFEIVHAFWTKDWAGLSWQLLLGLMYVALGLLLVGMAISSVMVLSYIFVRSTGQPELLLTYGLGLLLLLSGFVRLLLGWSRWHQSGWVMVLSGMFGLAAGVVVWPNFRRRACGSSDFCSESISSCTARLGWATRSSATPALRWVQSLSPRDRPDTHPTGASDVRAGAHSNGTGGLEPLGRPRRQPGPVRVRVSLPPAASGLHGRRQAEIGDLGPHICDRTLELQTDHRGGRTVLHESDKRLHRFEGPMIVASHDDLLESKG